MRNERHYWYRFLSAVLVALLLMGSSPFLISTASAKSSSNENVMVDVPWELINKCGHQAVSGPCQAYCWAYCRIILDRTSHTYRDYWTGSQATLPSVAGYTSQTTKMTTKQKLLETICSNVDLGRPVVVRVKGTGNAPYHFVVAIGYKADRDPKNMKESDILILNPASSSIKAGAKSSETYTFLNSCTLSTIAAGERDDGYAGNYVCWTTSSGGAVMDKPVSTTYTVTFNANGGSVFLPSMSVTNGTIYNSLPNPTREGYSFTGWYTEKSGGSLITPFTTVNLTGNQTLYAHWTKNDNPATYTVTFNANGGTVFMPDMTVTNGATYNTLPNPTRDGYVFAGWYTEKSGGSLITPSTTVNLTGNQTLYAHWTVEAYTVTFNANGGSVSTTSKAVTNGSTYGTLPTPTRSGYNFDGWYTATSGGTKITSSTTVNLTGNQNLYAHWTKTVTMCTVTFDANGGTVSQKTVQVAKGSTLNSLPTPTRSGYTFVLWSNSNGASGLKIEAGKYIVEQDVTLYAWWQEEKTQNTGHWGPWSNWTTKSYTASNTRQVETKEVQTVVAHMEYRYGRYVDQTGSHNCWCGKYLEGLSYISGKAKLEYSNWGTTRYNPSGSTWTCGQCNGNHIGVDHVDSTGRSIWAEYRLPGNKPFYWEESKIVGAQYETQYRYRDWIVD